MAGVAHKNRCVGRPVNEQGFVTHDVWRGVALHLYAGRPIASITAGYDTHDPAPSLQMLYQCNDRRGLASPAGDDVADHDDERIDGLRLEDACSVELAPKPHQNLEQKGHRPQQASGHAPPGPRAYQTGLQPKPQSAGHGAIGHPPALTIAWQR